MSGIPVPEKLSQNLLQFDGDDIAWTIFCFGELVLAMLFVRSDLLTLAIFIIWAVLMLRPRNARLYYVLLVDIPIGVRTRLNHGVEYDESKRRSKITRVFPHPNIRWFDFEDPQLPSQGFVELSEGDGFMVAIEGTGTTAAAQDIEVQEAAIEAIAASTRSIQGQVALIYQNRPHDPNEEKNRYATLLSPRVVKLPATQREQYRRYALQEDTVKDGADYIASAASSPSMVVTITVPNNESEDDSDTWTLKRYRTVFDSAEQYVPRLQSFGVTDAKICTRDDMTRHFRRTWDANTLQQFYEAIQNHLYGDGAYPSHLPRYVRHHKKGYLQLEEDNFVAVLEVVRTAGVIDRSRFKELFGALNKQGQPIWYSFITLGEYANAKGESNVLKKAVPIIEDTEDFLFGEENRELDYDAQQRANENRERLQEIGFYRYEQMTYVRFLTVFGSDPDDLQDNLRTLASLAEAAGFKTRQIKRVAPLKRFFASSLGINGV